MVPKFNSRPLSSTPDYPWVFIHKREKKVSLDSVGKLGQFNKREKHRIYSLNYIQTTQILFTLKIILQLFGFNVVFVTRNFTRYNTLYNYSFSTNKFHNDRIYCFIFKSTFRDESLWSSFKKYFMNVTESYFKV